MLWPQVAIYIQFGPKKRLFLLNFTIIMWFLGDLGLMLFDIFKGAVFPKILGFKQYFWFSGSKRPRKWTKTVIFGCVPFHWKFKLLNNYLNTVFVLLKEYLWSKFQEDGTIFGRVRPKTRKKGQFHRCWINTKNLINENY